MENFFLFTLDPSTLRGFVGPAERRKQNRKEDPSMQNMDNIIRNAIEDILHDMTETEIRNMVETYITLHPVEIANMIEGRIRKIAESVLYDLPF